MRGIIRFSKLLIIPLILIVVSDCKKDAFVEQYTGSFRFNIKFNRYDYYLLKNDIDTAITYDGRIDAYRIGDFMRDLITPIRSDNHSDHRLTIEFDKGKIITPLITQDGVLSLDEFYPKFSLGGRFNNPDNVSFEIFIEFAHWYTDNYRVTGQRLR